MSERLEINISFEANEVFVDIMTKSYESDAFYKDFISLLDKEEIEIKKSLIEYIESNYSNYDSPKISDELILFYNKEKSSNAEDSFNNLSRISRVQETCT